MMNKDYILRGMAFDEHFRVFAVQNTAAVQKARDLHDLSPIATLLLGRLLSAAAMMSWDLKNPKAEITLRVDGEGLLQGAVAICTAAGKLRGYAHNPSLFLDEPKDNFLTGKYLGKGTITTIRNDAVKTPYSGTCQLVSGEIAEDLAEYYLQSEQIPTAVNLGILIDKEATIRAAGGFIIQQLPFADELEAEQLRVNIQATPNVSDLMDMGYTIKDILDKFVFKGIPWQQTDEREIEFRCVCTRERFANALKLLGKEELSTMVEGIEPVCHYCNTTYTFNHDDMINLIKLL
ncbi:MAG: Hsp33 family molecular chaperone HslO [Candidatus Cloacimonetes bacterium]|nr:Hsp33 family molecular chaperone HslO [Candidatus Cloacimonadota bacterium]